MLNNNIIILCHNKQVHEHNSRLKIDFTIYENNLRRYNNLLNDDLYIHYRM